MLLQGLVTALVTPFQANGALDLLALRRHIAFQVENGVDGVLVLGSTGEASTLNDEEQELVIATAVDELRGRIPLMVGCGTNATVTTIAKVQRAAALGADTALVVTPYYNRPTQEGLRRHFEAVETASPLPICLYNIPKRTGCLMSVSLIDELFGLPKIIGIKESSGEMAQIQATLQIAENHSKASIMSGDDPLALPMMALGAHGTVAVLSNLLPEPMVQMVRHAQNNDFAAARALHQQLWPLMQAAFLETNPMSIKAMLRLCGRSLGSCRLPLCDVSIAGEIAIRAALEKAPLSTILTH
jgi:4-hydroxy-tetrahydrodipicolinate synthase